MAHGRLSLSFWAPRLCAPARLPQVQCEDEDAQRPNRRRRRLIIQGPEPEDPMERAQQVAELSRHEQNARALRSHRAKVGHLAAAVRNVDQATSLISDFAAKICRTVFGEWGSAKAGPGRSTSQNLAVFQGSDGSAHGHSFNTKISEQFSRMRCIGIWSLFSAQRDGLLRWFGKGPSEHCILVQTADDVNVWLRGNQNSLLR